MNPASRLIRRLNLRQRSLMAGFFANLAVVLVGFALADQPLVSLPMTWPMRGGIMVVMMVLLWSGVQIEQGRERR